MRIAVLGATGMAGSAVVTEALARGHRVIAFSRTPETENGTDRLTVHAGDVCDTESLAPVLARADVSVLTIRVALGEEHRLAPLTRGVLDTAADHGTRVLVIGGAAPLRSPKHPEQLLIEDPDYVPAAWKSVARASVEQFHACKDHPYTGWVYLSPPAIFEPGERTGTYRRGTTTLLTDQDGTARISAPDLAIAVVDELENPSEERHFTVSREHSG